MIAPGERPLFCVLIAGEESGDRLGAALMRTLRRQSPGIRFAGVGGDAMAAEGLDSLFPIGDLAIVGFAAILRQLPAVLARIRATAQAVIATRPDVLVVIDSPEFTHRVARKVRAAMPDLPIVDYVSPSVWAWRPGRAKAMRAYVDHVLAILPFEPDAHARLGGPPCTYVGHPLAEEIATLRPNAAEAVRRASDPPVVLALPGSRGSEIRRLIEPFGEALEKVARQLGPLELILPTVPHLEGEVRARTASWSVVPRIITDPMEKRTAFRIARAALAASGTVTLELALAGVPFVAAYRFAGWEAAIGKRLVRLPSVILANLVLGAKVAPEFIQEKCTPDLLAHALALAIGDTAERRAQIDAFAALDRVMAIGEGSPSEKAASIVLEVARSRDAYRRRDTGT